MRDLWKEKFINHSNEYQRYENSKKLKSELKFPTIFNKEGLKKDESLLIEKETHKSTLEKYEDLFNLEDCNLVKNSKPKNMKDEQV
jgi:hypothetical protein